MTKSQNDGSTTARQSVAKLEQAITNLEAATEKLGGKERVDGELVDSLRSENAALRDTINTVTKRLDATIGRLNSLMEE